MFYFDVCVYHPSVFSLTYLLSLLSKSVSSLHPLPPPPPSLSDSFLVCCVIRVLFIYSMIANRLTGLSCAYAYRNHRFPFRSLSSEFSPLSLRRFPLSAAASGKSKYIIGDGTNIVDFTYVENVAYAHLLAAVHLTKGARIDGQVRRLVPLCCVRVGARATCAFVRVPYVVCCCCARSMSTRAAAFK